MHTRSDLDFTLFYFDSSGSYDDLIFQLKRYIDAGPTRLELFYFCRDAQLISPSQVRDIIPVAAKASDVRVNGGKTALLYGRDVLYGLGRVYKVAENRILQRNWSTEIFKELRHAAEWLEIPEDIINEMITLYN
ncbi:MAG: hypothetical protein JXX29_01950 [Deltaproteobacteria bacterium]|nr:hypothetical protein [Deltaproteobacteria bacterium]MBN2670404.1 hypothetical protein [Deltaproteobacteria bacterium]